MKRNKYIASLLTLIILSSSCSLDETIFDTATPITAIKSQPDVENNLVGAYSNLNAVTLFGRDILWSLHPYADDLSSVVAFEVGTFGRKSLVNSGTNFINTVYSGFYSTIKDAYGVIDNVNRLDLDAAFEGQIQAEADFLIGFSYFHLVQLFGGVPLVQGSVDAGSDFYLPRSTVDEIYAEVFVKFEAAIPLLPSRTTQPGNQFYRATKGAAQAYLAKAYLTYANYLDLHERSGEAAPYYQKAKDMADTIIGSGQYVLKTNYGDLWDVNKEKDNYTEVIFAIPHTRDPSNITTNSDGTYLPVHFLPPTYPNSTGGASAIKAGNGFLRVQPWFFEKYTKGDYVNDYRVEKTFLSTWIDQNNRRHVAYPRPIISTDIKEKQAFLQKYVDPAGVGVFGHENDFYLMRFSEIYLIKAEAENELNGPTDAALEAFNKVRERARLADGTPRAQPANIISSPSKGDFRMKIFDERGLEFVGEFNRFFDLIRMKYMNTTKTMYEYQFKDFIPALPAGLPGNNAAAWRPAANPGGVTEASNYPEYDPKYLLWPIPANQVAVNPNLLPNNPGW